MTPSISNKTRILEIVAVIVTAGGKFYFMDYLNWRFPFIAVAILFWIGYILYRQKQNKEILVYWGFRTDNFKDVAKRVLPFGLISVITFLGVALFRNTLNLTWHILPILILYPVWGVIQQFLLIALTTGNLKDMDGVHWNKSAIILLTAFLFASIHYPFVWLAAATFVLAAFYGIVYWKERNIYVLGIFHGWLGGFFYYTVLGRDPFLETFGELFHLTN